MDGLLLLVGPESHKTALSDLDDLETDTGKITLSVAGSTETSNEDLIVLIDEGHATITRNVGGNSLVVLLELDSHALSDGRVRLLSFDGDLLDNDTGGVRSASKRLLPLREGVLLLVAKIGPPIYAKNESLANVNDLCDLQLESAVDSQLTTSVDTRRLMLTHYRK